MTTPLFSPLMLLALLFMSGGANAACPQGKDEYVGKVVAVHYSNENYSPTFIYEGYGNDWITLSANQGLNTEYGKAMLAMLLTGLSLDMYVEIKGCNDGKVNEITIQNAPD